MNKKKLFLTIFISGMAFVINYFINFFLTRFITEKVGTDAYGYVTLAKTFATYAIIFTTALNSYSSRYITIEYHQKNYVKANIYFNSVLFANIFIGIALVIISGIFSFFANSMLNVPKLLVKDVQFLIVLVFINLCISLAGTAFQSAAVIKNKLYLSSAFRVVSYFTEAVTLLVIFRVFPAKLYFVGCGLISATIVVFASNYLIFRTSIPEIRISIHNFNILAIKELIINGIWNSFNSLGNTLNSGLDLLVSNTLLSGVAMGQVSIVKTFTCIFNSLYQMVAQPFEPILLRDFANEEKGNLLEHLKFASKISGFVSNLAFAGIVALGLTYYQLWVPQQNCVLLYKLTIIAVATSILEGAVYPLYYIYTLTLKNRIPCVITIMGGGLNVLGMFILIKFTRLNVYAVFITTAVIMVFINFVTNPIYMTSCLGLKWSYFYPMLLRHILSCAVMTIILRGISLLINPQSWTTMIGCGIICALVALPIHCVVVFDHKEKQLLIHIIKSRM